RVAGGVHRHRRQRCTAGALWRAHSGVAPAGRRRRAGVGVRSGAIARLPAIARIAFRLQSPRRGAGMTRPAPYPDEIRGWSPVTVASAQELKGLVGPAQALDVVVPGALGLDAERAQPLPVQIVE